MDLRLTDWLAATETASDMDAASIAAVGEQLMRDELTLPPAITAECHVRIAALRLRGGDAQLAVRHAIHAATLALDMPAEAQLHVLPRALGVAKTAEHHIGDALPTAQKTQDHAAETVGRAMTTAVQAADRGLIELAVIEALEDGNVEIPPPEREQMRVALGQHRARLALQFETSGEMQLARQAGRGSATQADR